VPETIVPAISPKSRRDGMRGMFGRATTNKVVNEATKLLFAEILGSERKRNKVKDN